MTDLARILLDIVEVAQALPTLDDLDRNTLPGPLREAMNVAEREIWKRAHPTKPSIRFRLRKFPFGRP